MQGFNILLISRNYDKLSEVKNELLTWYPNIKCDIIPFDFDWKYSKEAYDHLFNSLDNYKEVSILINNVGILNGSLFHLQEEKIIQSHLNINTVPIVYLSKYY